MSSSIFHLQDVPTGLCCPPHTQPTARSGRHGPHTYGGERPLPVPQVTPSSHLARPCSPTPRPPPSRRPPQPCSLREPGPTAAGAPRAVAASAPPVDPQDRPGRARGARAGCVHTCAHPARAGALRPRPDVCAHSWGQQGMGETGFCSPVSASDPSFSKLEKVPGRHVAIRIHLQMHHVHLAHRRCPAWWHRCHPRGSRRGLPLSHAQVSPGTN